MTPNLGTVQQRSCMAISCLWSRQEDLKAQELEKGEVSPMFRDKPHPTRQMPSRHSLHQIRTGEVEGNSREHEWKQNGCQRKHFTENLQHPGKVCNAYLIKKQTQNLFKRIAEMFKRIA